MIEKKEEHDSRVKTQKGSLERKWESFQRLTGKANKRMKSQQLGSIWSLYEVFKPFQNQKIWTFYSRVPSPNFLVYHGGSWRLSNWHIQRLEKMNLFKMLDFQRNYFSRKRHWKRATPLPNKIVKINLLSQIIRFQVNAHSGISNSDHHFFGILKSKRRWLFRNNKSSFENILVSSAEETSFWK